MAISSNRVKVAGAIAEVKNRIDFITSNEVDRFNTILEIPSTVASTALDLSNQVIDVASQVDTSKIYDAIGELDFSNSITSAFRNKISLDAGDVMTKALGRVGSTLGAKRLMGYIFGDCPYDGFNLNFLWGLLLGLIPSLGGNQQCSRGLLTMLKDVFSGDTTPEMIGKSLTGLVNKIKDGKGTDFLNDLNLNADVMHLGSNVVDINKMIGKIVDKSDLMTSRNPREAYNTMVENMRFNNAIFNNTNDNVVTIAKKNSLARRPILPASDNDAPKKLELSDLLSIKVKNGNKNIFDSSDYI